MDIFWKIRKYWQCFFGLGLLHALKDCWVKYVWLNIWSIVLQTSMICTPTIITNIVRDWSWINTGFNELILNTFDTRTEVLLRYCNCNIFLFLQICNICIILVKAVFLKLVSERYKIAYILYTHYTFYSIRKL
jgi:hypothetical protein